MSLLLVAVSLLFAFFVGYNVGGSTTAPAFGPAVGATLVRKHVAGLLMAVFFTLGGAMIGRRVVDTLGREILEDTGVFGVEVSIIFLGFVGGALYLGNRVGVPASTSMTTVGTIAGLGVASGELNRSTMAEIAFWWLAAPVVGLVASVGLGAYVYPRVAALIDASKSDELLLEIEWTGGHPSPTVHDRKPDQLVAAAVILVTGCLMAFSSGSSNVANVIAPFVGADLVGMNPAILFGSVAVAVGALGIGRRTLETLGKR